MSNRLRELSKHRLEQAYRCLESAKLLMDAGDYRGAANRSYFCIFYCIRSVLALSQVDFKKHSAVISYFRRKYIKPGLLDTYLSDIITELFQVRVESDYDDFYTISKGDVAEQIRGAQFFYKQIKAFLEENMYGYIT